MSSDENEGPLINCRPYHKAGSENEALIRSFAVGKMYMSYGTIKGQVGVLLIDTCEPVQRNFSLSTHIINSLSFDQKEQVLLVSSFGETLFCQSIQENSNFPKTYQHTDKILCSAIDPAFDPFESSDVKLSCVFADDKNKITRLKQKKSIFTTTQVSKMIGASSKKIDSIVWKGDIICWATEDVVSIYNAKTDEPIMDCKATTLSITSQKKFWVCMVPRSDEIVHCSMCGSMYECNLKTQKYMPIEPKSDVAMFSFIGRDQGRLMIKNYDTEKPQFYVEATRGDETLKDDIHIENISLYDLQSFYKFIGHRDCYFFAFKNIIYKITLCHIVERIQHFLNRNDVKRAKTLLRENLDKLEQSEAQQYTKQIAEKQMENGANEDAVRTMLEFTPSAKFGFVYDLFKEHNLLHVLGSMVDLAALNPQIFSSDKMTEIMKALILAKDADAFSAGIKSLHNDRYNPEDLITAIQKLENKGGQPFRASLATLYLSTQKYREQGFKIALDDSIPEIFDGIAEYKAYDYPLQNSLLFFEKFGDYFINFLIDHTENIKWDQFLGSITSDLNTIQKTAKNMEEKKAKEQTLKKMKLSYLHAIYQNDIKEKRDVLRKYGTDLAILYLEADHPDTIKFLESNTSFDYNTVRDAALLYHRKSAAAYLCRKTGDPVKGIQILLAPNTDGSKDNDPLEAIKYAAITDDKKVWAILTSYSYRNENYMLEILRKLPTLHLNPVKYVRGIPDSIPPEMYMKAGEEAIKGFRRKLTTAELTHDIVAKDAFGAFSRSFDRYRRAKPVESK